MRNVYHRHRRMLFSPVPVDRIIATGRAIMGGGGGGNIFVE